MLPDGQYDQTNGLHVINPTSSADIDPQQTTGISHQEAARRLADDGPNELPSSRPRSLAAMALGVLREPMIALLVAAGVLYVFLGDIAEASLLLASILVVIGINLFQERRTERALEALRDLSSPRALVIRNGEQVRIAGRDVVTGDLLVLAEGDRVAADAAVIRSMNLTLDESLLTGESVPVGKIATQGDVAYRPPGAEDGTLIYSGTLVVGGQGWAEVLATGANTELGRIGKQLRTIEQGRSRLQDETRRIVRFLAIIALALCVLTSVIYGLTHSWVDGLLTGITLAMAIIPEEFPLVLTVFLGLGAWRLSRQQVLTRRLPAIETLGSATVLCVDKTGTLTLNRMAVRRLFTDGQSIDPSQAPATLAPAYRELINAGILASQRDPFDPTERAIHELAPLVPGGSEQLQSFGVLERQYPLSQSLLALSHVWCSADGVRVVAAKGAPEAIADLCHLDEDRTRKLDEEVEAMASDGLRVLGVATAPIPAGSLPERQHDFDFMFLGLIGLLDPIRPAVPAAIAECLAAGIRVVMMTGDHAVTAKRIARDVGLSRVDVIMTGSELNLLSDAELRKQAGQIDVFARVVPEQKLRLVNALKANGEVVAMTGDGVNDAPALRAADIGVAMGGRGTDVAREAADLVLLDDDFSSIVRSARTGRGIYDNLRKAMAYLLAVHIPIAGLSLLPVLLGTPLVLFPAHVVFLELIIDPACSMAFEAEPTRPDIMRRPPRPVDQALFNGRMVGLSVLQGSSVLIAVLGVYAITWGEAQNELEARGLTFTTLVLANLLLILVNRSWTRTIVSTLRVTNAPFWLVVSGALVLLGLTLYLPFLRDTFRLASPSPGQLALCFAAALAGVVWFEAYKFVAGRRAADEKSTRLAP
jgi:Ca2+-transporting ATPase